MAEPNVLGAHSATFTPPRSLRHRKQEGPFGQPSVAGGAAEYAPQEPGAQEGADPAQFGADGAQGRGRPSGGFFYTGTNDGVTVNRSPVPEDTQTWTHLALGSPYYARSLDRAASQLAVPDTAERPDSTVPQGQSYEGVIFSSAALVGTRTRRSRRDSPSPTATASGSRAPRISRSPCASVGLSATRRAHGGCWRPSNAPRNCWATARPWAARRSPRAAGWCRRAVRWTPVSGSATYPYRHTGATAWYLPAAARANPLAVRDAPDHRVV